MLLAAACGMDQPVTGAPGASKPPAGSAVDGVLTVDDRPVEGPALSIADALAAAGDPVAVMGALVVPADGPALLCGALAESFPPQCGGERLEVVGLDLDALELDEGGGVRWTSSIQLVGTIEAP